MNILTVSKRGTLKLPREALSELNGAKHLLIRATAGGITLTPVKIEAAVSIRGIPAMRPDKPR